MSTIDTTSVLGSLLHEHRDQIIEIAALHHARNVRVFGSVARGEATAASDIDLLVDFDKDSSLFDVLHLADELEALLGRGVDVVSSGGLKRRDDRIGTSVRCPMKPCHENHASDPEVVTRAAP